MPTSKAAATASLAAASLLFLSGSIRADGVAIPYDQALGVIQASEQAVQKSKWTARVIWGKRSEYDNEATRRTPDTDPNQLTESKVYSDPAAGKYRCDIHTIGEWVGGSSPYVKSFTMNSFDGKVERNYEQHTHSDGTPSNQPPTTPLPGELVIEPERADRFLSTWGSSTGIGKCPPYFANVKVSELVKNTVRVHGNVLIREASPGVWLIRVQDPEAPTMAYNLTYDLGKGGLVTAATWEAFDPNLDKRVFTRYTTELGQTSDGHYYPKVMHSDALVDKRYVRVELSDYEYGSPYDDSVYQLDCPPGTHVVDKIGRKFYIIGGGPSSDRDQTRDFLRMTGLAGDPVGPPPPSSGVWWKIEIATGAAVLVAVFVVALYFTRRRWRRGGGSKAALLAILAAAGAGRAAAAPPEPARLARVLNDLNADDFEARERASAELDRFGEGAVPALRKALEGSPPAEARRRLEQALERVNAGAPSGPLARSLRAVEVLEHIDSPAARALLKRLADGAPGARLTKEAKAALQRLPS